MYPVVSQISNTWPPLRIELFFEDYVTESYIKHDRCNVGLGLKYIHQEANTPSPVPALTIDKLIEYL